MTDQGSGERRTKSGSLLFVSLLRRPWAWFGRNWTWLRWPVLVALLAYLFYHHRRGFIDLADRRIQWGYWGVAFVLCGGSLILTFLRWYLLVWAQEFPFRFRDALRLSFVGYMLNYVAPGATGGDLFKAVLIAREQTSRRTVAVATIVLDRLLGLLALFMVGAATSLYPTPLVQRAEFRPIVITFWAGSLLGLIGVLILMHPAVPRSRWWNRLVRLPWIGRGIGELVNGVLLYQSKPRVLVATMLISFLGHLGILSSFYFCARALHPAEAIPLYWSHLQFVPAAELAGVIVPLPGGTGALEEAVAVFYGLAGASHDNGFLTAIAFRVISIVLAGIGGCYYFTTRREVDQALEDDHEASSPRSAIEQPQPRFSGKRWA